MKKDLLIIIIISILMITLKGTIVDFNLDKVVYETKDSYQKMLAYQEDEMVDIAEEKIIVRVKSKQTTAYETLVSDVNGKTSDQVYRTAEEAHTARKNKSDLLKNYHQTNNKKTSDEIKLTGYVEKYVSTYGPFVEYTYRSIDFLKDQKNILKIASSASNCEKVYVLNYDVYETEPLLYTSTNETGIHDIYMDRTYTGDGIYVGIMEPGGNPDLTHGQLVDTDCEIYTDREYGTPQIDEHTTAMAMMIAGKDGIAPDAKIKNAALIGSMIDEMDWFVSKGVDIINMSYGESYPKGMYNDDSAYVDYISYTYDIIMVAAVGNSTHNTNIANPALGYNVMSMGASDMANDVVWENSSYTVANRQQPLKPTMLVAGESINICGIYIGSGTSASTALATANIAIFLEMHPNFIGKPERVIALFVANARPLSTELFPPSTTDIPLLEKAGAGRLYTKGAHDNVYKIVCFNNSTGNTHDDVYTVNLTLHAGETIRISTVWKAKTDGTVSTLKKGDYDLLLKSSAQSVLALSNSVRSVVELLTYTTTIDRSVQIVVTQSSNRVGTVDRVCIAYQIIQPTE